MQSPKTNVGKTKERPPLKVIKKRPLYQNTILESFYSENMDYLELKTEEIDVSLGGQTQSPPQAFAKKESDQVSSDLKMKSQNQGDTISIEEAKKQGLPSVDEAFSE